MQTTKTFYVRKFQRIGVDIMEYSGISMIHSNRLATLTHHNHLQLLPIHFGPFLSLS